MKELIENFKQRGSNLVAATLRSRTPNKKGGFILKKPMAWSGSFLLLSAILVMIVCLASHCEKPANSEQSSVIENSDPINVVLYDKDTITIQKHIQGRWQVLYVTGGISATYKGYFDDLFVEFTADKNYIHHHATIWDIMPYVWHKDEQVWYKNFILGDSAYIMTPIDCCYSIFERIYNDTLIFSNYYISEPQTYYCIKSN